MWTTATESRTSGSADRAESSAELPSGRARWHVCPRAAARSCGRWAARRSSSSLAPAEAMSVGRGGRPPTSISSPARSASEAAQAKAAAAAAAPVASPTAATKTNRSLIFPPASRRRRS